MTFLRGDLVIGGLVGYAEHILANTTFVEHIHALDIHNNDCGVWGATFDKRGNCYMALNPVGEVGNDNNPHDVVWMPDDSGLLYIQCVSDGVAELKKLNLAGTTILDTWTGIDVDTTWTHQPLKLDIACDSRTVYYTDRGKTIFKYDLVTRANLTPFAVLSDGSPYEYRAFKLLPPTHTDFLVVALTTSGNGPSNAICLSDDGKIWTDEINPLGAYHIFKRNKLDGDNLLIHTVSLDLIGSTDNEISALACYFNRCAARAPYASVIGAN